MISSEFDLLRISNQPNEHTLKRPFIFPFILCFIGFAYGLIGMDPKEVQFEQPLSPSYYRDSPYLFYHFYHPRSSWQQSENILVSTIVQTLTTYGIFALYYRPTVRQLMFRQSDDGRNIVQNGRRLNRKVSKQILRCDRKWTRRILVIFAIFLLNSFVFIYPKTFKNPYFKLNFRQTFFWFLLFPVLLMYYIYAVSSIFLFSIKNLEYFLVKQRFILDRIGHSKLWFHFISHNRDLATLCQEIQDYNHLWGGYFSLNFAMVIDKICFQAYILLFPSKHDRIRANYLVYLIYYWCSIMLFTLKCASIERNNIRILRENQRYYLRLAESRSTWLPARLIKEEELHQSRRLCHFCIQIFPNYSITSRTFSEIISYVVLIFLYIVGLYR